MGFHSHLYSRPLVPNIQDPTAVDFRAFYPYTPNEVKHRKRTTNQQLKVLENVFKSNTKPNAQLRQELSVELAMTPRGVQVWFQNRRAKEKSKALKIAKAGGSISFSDAEDGELSPSSTSTTKQEPRSVASTSVTPECASESVHDSLGMSARTSSTSSIPHVPSPPQLHVRTDASSLRSNSPIENPPDSAASYSSLSIPQELTAAAPHPSAFNNPRFGSMGLTSEELYSLRRGSLPVLPAHSAYGQQHDSPHPDMAHYDPFVRRGSVDASLQRLASNPYAPLARAKNSALYGAGVGVAVSGSSAGNSTAHIGAGATRYHPNHNRIPSGYPSLQRRNASPSLLPAGGQFHPSLPANTRRFSMDSRATRIAVGQRNHHSASPSPLTPYNAVIRASLPEHHLYSVVARPVASPIPGPLPTLGYQFGAANSASPSSVDSERNSPDSPKSFTFGGDDDSQTSPSFYSSRFGSIASIATSESSVNSSYYGEQLVGSAVDHTEQRESSCAPPSQYMSVYADIDASNQADHVQHCAPVNSVGIDNIGSYSSHDELASYVAVDSVASQTSTYPSPSSTISAGGSPSQLPVSTSSALAYALDEKHVDQKPIGARDSYANFASSDQSVGSSPPNHGGDESLFQHSRPYPPVSFPQDGSICPSTYYGDVHNHPAQNGYSVFGPNGEYPASVLEHSLTVDSFVTYP